MSRKKLLIFSFGVDTEWREVVSEKLMAKPKGFTLMFTRLKFLSDVVHFLVHLLSLCLTSIGFRQETRRFGD
ncbi:hypothetical protein ACE6H2_028159 [Prunus campanulata]